MIDWSRPYGIVYGERQCYEQDGRMFDLSGRDIVGDIEGLPKPEPGPKPHLHARGNKPGRRPTDGRSQRIS